MRVLFPEKGLVLLVLLLTACAASAPAVQEDESIETVSSSWAEARVDPTCVVPLCDGERCAIWRCQDVAEEEEEKAPPIILARGNLPVARPPMVFRPVPGLRPPTDSNVSTELRSPLADTPERWWGHPVAAPTYADPVFEIPWHNWKTRDRFVPKQLRHWMCSIPPREPYEKHHIFPQRKTLAKWLTDKGIDIHAFTIRLPRSFHQWLHSGGPQGGQWNEAWRQFIDENRYTASVEDIWRFAGELMLRFGVNGPLIPYYCD
ncbi:putative lipoprotein (TIGR02269 family) [Archangium gephyra]|uniref:Lipoprotein n=1 Tax=Archangium gephyra TaxID=48 RepID=A0AAC8QGZ1_9BACT|nr:TIGR02269 family lipoprotein [Archangium gephyra]AKJ06921.1 putative lipoprotein [Archangium gephyra]REG31790.1 putative lipoprotein (TIGR02269 family) [Archangium gephyra]